VAGVLESSYCPLCDAERSEATCPVHHVPTLPPPTGETPPPIAHGSRIADRYRVEGVLSHGGMGTVLDAVQVGIRRQVVVKILRDARPEERGRIRRFYQEARLISALDHPNIVRIYEFGLDPVYRVPYIVMEKVEGATLQQAVHTEGPLSERRAARLFTQIVRALIEAHRKGVLHRDLKPRNVMVRRLPEGGEHLTVLDFGLAKFIEDDQLGPPLTAPGRTVGTPGFMSPEQVLGRPLDFRSDLYGLGCMLYAALTGQPPFAGSAALAVMRKQVREPPPPLPERLADQNPPSPQLRTLLDRLLAKDPERRPQTLEEVLRAFERSGRGPAGWIDDATTRVEPVTPQAIHPPSGEDVEAGIVTARTPLADDLEAGVVTPKTSPTRGHLTSEPEPDAMVTVRVPPANLGPPEGSREPASSSDDSTTRRALGPRRGWLWATVAAGAAVFAAILFWSRF